MNRTILTLTVIFLTFLGCWELGGITSKKFRFFASQPSEIFPIWLKEIVNPTYWGHFYATLLALLMGYALALLVGYILGVLAYWFRRKKIDLDILLLVLGSIPVFALAPLLILGFGSGFGVRVAVVTLSSVFLIASGVFQSLKFMDETYGSIARDLSFSNKVLWKKFLLPAGFIFSVPAFKGAVALSLIGVFVAEWISSQQGLGKYILSSMSLYDAPRLMIGIMSFMIISSMFMIAISILDKRTARWRNFR